MEPDTGEAPTPPTRRGGPDGALRGRERQQHTGRVRTGRAVSRTRWRESPAAVRIPDPESVPLRRRRAVEPTAFALFDLTVVPGARLRLRDEFRPIAGAQVICEWLWRQHVALDSGASLPRPLDARASR
jgi:hypothetical protein